MRRISQRYPIKHQVLDAAKTTYYIKSVNGKDLKRVSFKCAQCGKAGLTSDQKEVDHIVPMGKFTDWNSYIAKLFCDASGLQILCLPCHDAKTLAETGERTKRRRKKT